MATLRIAPGLEISALRCASREFTKLRSSMLHSSLKWNLRSLHLKQKNLRHPGAVRAAAADASGSFSTSTDEKWIKLLPDKKAAIYSHSLPCIEAWLRSLGFEQRKDDRACWLIQRPDWHAMLSLDITELRIRYLKSGPGNLDRDVERKFSYAFCREDIENAILGGP